MTSSIDQDQGGRGGQSYRVLQSSVEALRQSAWDRFVDDYVSGKDDDPADARARYRAELSEIEQIGVRHG